MPQGGSIKLTQPVSVNEDYYPHQKFLCSWEVPNYTGDPFLSIDGQFVGMDHFQVPRNFEEFETSSPMHIISWVGRRLKRHTSDSMVEDLASDLAMHMRQLPAVSKWRDRGFKDVIDVFNPWSCYGASTRRFYGYVNRCLGNKLITLGIKQGRDALGNIAVSFGDVPQVGGNDGYVAPVESFETWIHDNSKPLRDELDHEASLIHKKLFADKFISFVQDSRPDLIDTLEAIMYFDKVKDMALVLSMSTNEFQKQKRELVELGACFAGRQ